VSESIDGKLAGHAEDCGKALKERLAQAEVRSQSMRGGVEIPKVDCQVLINLLIGVAIRLRGYEQREIGAAVAGPAFAGLPDFGVDLGRLAEGLGRAAGEAVGKQLQRHNEKIDQAIISLLERSPSPPVADPLVEAVREMRALQRRYFATRNRDLIPQSKAAEKRVDELLAAEAV
jgi:hypothetical protein